jgi:hypothetical protein
VTRQFGANILVPALMLAVAGTAVAVAQSTRSQEAQLLSKLLAEIDELKSQVVPAGAVLAFYTECPASENWVPHYAAAGRFLLGAGFGEGLTPQALGKKGGKEQEVLSIEQMPKHSHDIKRGIVGDNNNYAAFFNTHVSQTHPSPASTETAGDGQPLEIMPPFLAVSYCQKKI